MQHATAEIEKFNALAADWWHPHGPMAPLHLMNPARLGFITQHLPKTAKTGLDLGCGAGLLTEPLARLGYSMTGADGAADALAVAQNRAAAEGLNITYQPAHSADLVRCNHQFDFVCALELIEHVDDPASLVADICALTKRGGMIFLSTLNRTLKSRLLGIYAAEYVLRALPIGTHDYHKFIKPSELTRMLSAAGAELVALEGLSFNPLKKTFTRTPHNVGMNYILAAKKI